MISYRRLLGRYIRHVGNEEGSTFLAGYHNPDAWFTDEEWAELQRLESADDSFFAEPVEPDDDGPFWRVIITDTERPSGVGPICPSQGDVGKHSTGDGHGVDLDEQGVYDCCPGPHIECWSESVAVSLAALMNNAHVRMCD